MNLHHIINNGQRFLKANGPSILTGVGVAGTVSTAVLAAKGAVKADHLLREDAITREPIYDRRKRAVRQTKLTWKCYVPAASSAAVTIVAIVGANQVNAQRTAAAITAYSLTETAFSEYKDQVVKTIGAKQEQAIRDQSAAEKVTKTAPNANTIVVGSGDVLCCELHTGRYFMSTMEKLRRANNDINDKINHDLYVNLDEFYDLLDVPHTESSNRMGWDSDYGLVELTFSSVLTPEGVPCLAFGYSYLKPI